MNPPVNERRNRKNKFLRFYFHGRPNDTIGKLLRVAQHKLTSLHTRVTQPSVVFVCLLFVSHKEVVMFSEAAAAADLCVGLVIIVSVAN